MKSAERYGLGISIIVILVGSLFYFALAQPTAMDNGKEIKEDNMEVKKVELNKEFNEQKIVKLIYLIEWR